MVVTETDLLGARTARGGYSKAQVLHAQEMFPGKWKASIIGKVVTDEFWAKFVSLRNKSRRPAVESSRAKKILNSISKPDGWSWKPEVKDIPKAKFLTRKEKNKGKKKTISRFDNQKFYSSREWLELRVRVLEKYECKCMMCGRSPKEHGVVVHVDHIKPRSKHPELSLDFSNLQLLCSDCNIGKSNKYDTDYRPIERYEIDIIIESQKFI